MQMPASGVLESLPHATANRANRIARAQFTDRLMRNSCQEILEH
jgi:hypothetical protein